MSCTFKWKSLFYVIYIYFTSFCIVSHQVQTECGQDIQSPFVNNQLSPACVYVGIAQPPHCVKAHSLFSSMHIGRDARWQLQQHLLAQRLDDVGGRRARVRLSWQQITQRNVHVASAFHRHAQQQQPQQQSATRYFVICSATGLLCTRCEKPFSRDTRDITPNSSCRNRLRIKDCVDLWCRSFFALIAVFVWDYIDTYVLRSEKNNTNRPVIVFLRLYTYTLFVLLFSAAAVSLWWLLCIMSSSEPVLGASDASQPCECVVPPSDTASRPLDADKAAVDPDAGEPETTDLTVTSGTTAPRATGATVKPQRKTCILKLDGCHYTIGENAWRTAIALVGVRAPALVNFDTIFLFKNNQTSCQFNVT